MAYKSWVHELQMGCFAGLEIILYVEGQPTHLYHKESTEPRQQVGATSTQVLIM
jgi:hypothetical protein